MSFKHFFNRHKQLFYTIFTPIIASSLPLLFGTKEAYSAFVLIILTVYWLTVCIPISITSLIPLVFFPLFEILPSRTITRIYFKDTVVLFYGSLVMAKAIEISGLHERIALWLMIKISHRPKWIMLSTMLITGLLSIWISNAGVCSLMIPILESVIDQFKLHNDPIVNSEENQIEDQQNNNADDSKDKSLRKLAASFYISCAYSSTIGGFSSLFKNPSNIMLKSYMDQNHPHLNMNFTKFILFTLPISFLLTIFSWIWLATVFLPNECGSLQSRPKNPELLKKLKQKYEMIGSIRFDQICVGILFTTLITFWILFDLDTMLDMEFVKLMNDSTISATIIILLFVCPKENIFKGKSYQHLIDWDNLQTLFPWDVILVIGGAICLSEGVRSSGLSEFLSNVFTRLIKNSMFDRKEIVLLFIFILSSLLTEFTINTTIFAVFIPIIDAIASDMNVNPVYFLLPLAFSCNFAFLFPLGSLNNTFIFGNEFLRMNDLIKSGIYINIFATALVYVSANTWMGCIFDLSSNANQTDQFNYQYILTNYSNNM